MAQALKLPLAGYRYLDGVTFHDRGSHTILWSSTPIISTNAYVKYLLWGNSTIHRYHDSQANSLSVRCIKD